MVAAEPTPREIRVKGVEMHRWAERDGTYAELVARRSGSLQTLPGRAGTSADRPSSLDSGIVSSGTMGT